MTSVLNTSSSPENTLSDPSAVEAGDRRRRQVPGPSIEAGEPAIATLASAQPLRLRRLLVGLDLLAASASWAVAVGLSRGGDGHPPLGTALLALPVLALSTVVVANARRLYRAQVCSIRAVEMQRVGQVALLVGLGAAVAGPRVGIRLPADALVLGVVASFALVNGFRGWYRSWLAGGRRQGRFQRQVVIVGSHDDARHLLDLVSDHPQLGLSVVGMVGEPTGSNEVAGTPPHLGPLDRAEELVRASGASGVLIAATALAPDDLNQVTRNLLQAGIHVHLSSGLQGFAAHRLRPQLLGNESVLYLEPLRLARWQLVAKRGLDVVVGTLALVASLPLLAIAALAIKLDDGGPVMFRQARIGRGGKHFTILKLRTMVPDAEAQYAKLATSLAGRTGPLVKLRRDPRITRVGRYLRASSIDELPQLVNVLRGEMSLVGPRPNLVVEAENLDPTFLAHKCQVRPGISGLWQVEARDDPSYNVYRRLDVFYLENWSISLDLAILVVTTQRVVGRAARLLGGGRLRRRELNRPREVETRLLTAGD